MIVALISVVNWIARFFSCFREVDKCGYLYTYYTVTIYRLNAKEEGGCHVAREAERRKKTIN